MLCDYHVHSRMCGDAVGEFEEYINCALERGITEIGFSGHCPQYYFPPEKRSRMCTIPEEEVVNYLETLEQLQKKYRNNITVRIGMEIDYLPGKEELLRPMLDLYQWDYLLLSVHYLGDWPFDDPQYLEFYQQQDVGEVYRLYYRTLIQGIQTGWFDIVAHFDLPKKFGHRPSEPVEAEDDALAACRKHQLVLEMNTAGYRKPVGEPYPSSSILRKAAQLGIPMCMGSDAHRPEEVSMDFPRAFETLQQAGFRELTGFSKREAFRYDFPGVALT